MFQKVLLDFIQNECDGSQKNLSVKTGLSTSTINSWCKGKSEPNSAQLVILADFFGCTTDELLGREPHDSAVDKRKEMRPSTLKLLDVTEKLNDMGIAVVLGYIARLIEENPEFVLPQYRQS